MVETNSTLDLIWVSRNFSSTRHGEPFSAYLHWWAKQSLPGTNRCVGIGETDESEATVAHQRAAFCIGVNGGCFGKNSSQEWLNAEPYSLFLTWSCTGIWPSFIIRFVRFNSSLIRVEFISSFVWDLSLTNSRQSTISIILNLRVWLSPNASCPNLMKCARINAVQKMILVLQLMPTLCSTSVFTLRFSTSNQLQLLTASS